MAGEAQACVSPIREQDQLWLVSQRGLGCNVEHQTENLKYWRYDREKRWVRSNLQELLAAEDNRLLTTIFVHGNRMSSNQAFTSGWTAYRALVRGADERPMRFIIWSWPSEQISGVVQDVRVKAARTTPAAYYLAWFVDRLDPHAPLSLWGYSFGARIVTGALHLLGGGHLRGDPPLARLHEERAPVNVVLAAAALDNDWLLAGRAHEQAATQLDRLLLVINRCDPVLKRYHRLYHRRACQQALGYAGLPHGCLAADIRTRIQQVDACCQVGKEHAIDGYLCSLRLMSLTRRGLMSEPTGAEPDANAAIAAGPQLVEP